MKIFRHIFLFYVILFSVTLFTTGCKPEPTLSVSAEYLNFGVSASEQSIEITSNTDWKIIGADGWCSATPAAGSGNATVRILTGDNTTSSEREKSITITAGTLSESVKITQRQKDALILSQKIYNVPAEFYVITVDLKSNVGYDVIIPSGISWITALGTKGVNSSAHQFAISANESHDGRSSVIVFRDKGSSLADTLTVNQAHKGALILSQKSYSLPPSSAFIDVELRTNTNYEISYPESVQWINLVNTKALTTYNFRFSVSENNLYESRTARVVFRDRSSSLSDTITITQSQREGVIFGSQRSFMVQRGGGALNYAVEFNIPYSVTIPADATWITDLQTKALTSASHTFLVLANNSGAERTGKIYLASVNGQFKDTIRIRQSAYNGFHAFIEEGSNLPAIIPSGDRLKIKNLKIEGRLRSSDFLFIRDMMFNLDSLDLERAIPEGNKIPDYAFRYELNPGARRGVLTPGTLTPGTLTPGSNLRWIKLPSLLLAIGKEAFYNCNLLTQIEIPTEVGAIGEGAFAECSSLALVISRIIYPFPLTNVFTGINPLARLMIPSGTLDAYKNIAGWSGGLFDKVYEEGTDPDDPGDGGGGGGDGGDGDGGDGDPPLPGIKDGDVVQLLSATVGSGVNLVFMGDGFIRTEIDNKSYENAIRTAVDHFFGVEPYKSYKDHFNVYMVYAISQESGISDPDLSVNTVFQTRYNAAYPNTSMTVNNTTCFNYALKTPVGSLSQTLITIVANSSRYGGTTRLYSDGAAIAIAPMSELVYPYDFRGLVQHEAGGHGFGKLADEYVTNVGSIPESQKTTLRQWQGYNHFQNVDLTSNMAEILWRHFSGVAGYGYVSAWEGGYYYAQGVWRPEQRSLMINNINYINAPGRELIVKRIKQISGLPYSFEQFRARDVNELSIATKAGEPTFDPKMALPPPVLVVR